MAEAAIEAAGEVFSVQLDAEIEVRDAAKREIDVRLVPWDFPIDTLQGREQFVRGAFDEVDPSSVLLMGLEHEAHIGVGQNGQPVLTRRPVGRSTALHNKADGQHATFRVAKTQAGDELLELAAEKIVRGTSIEFTETPGGTSVEKIGGRRTLFRRKVGLPGVSLTYRPAYGEQAAVLAVRSQSQKEPTVTEAVIASAEPINPIVNVTIGPEALAPLTESLTRTQTELAEKFGGEIEALKEQMRSQIIVPAAQPVAPPPYHLWLRREAYRLGGESIPSDLAAQFRTLDDVTAADNTGLIPTAYLPEVEGAINFRRPFLESTRQVTDPGGTVIQTARITQNTEAGIQSTEKTGVATRPLQTTPDTWNMVTIAGAVDVSLQFLRRGSPAAVQLLDDDMRSQHAQAAEAAALDALLAQAGVVEGGVLDAELLSLGDAFVSTWGAMNEGPDTIWLSTKALGKFIDAKASTSNAPLYSSIQASATAAGGITGTISGLRAVHVPQLVDVDVIVGPSRAYAWVQDGPVKLSADNAELAGRDIGYVGFYFFIPRYAAAFTTYGMFAS